MILFDMKLDGLGKKLDSIESKQDILEMKQKSFEEKQDAVLKLLAGAHVKLDLFTNKTLQNQQMKFRKMLKFQ